MKWGESSNKAGEKLTEFVSNVFGAKGLSILVSVGLFALLAGASWKWGI